MQVVEEITKNIEEFAEKTSLIEKQINEIGSKFEQFEERLSSLSEIGNLKTELSELQELVAKSMRPSASAAAAEKSIELIKKSFYQSIDRNVVQPELAEYLKTKQLPIRTVDDTSAGIFAPEEWLREILREVTEISPVRRYTRVFTTTAESIVIPKINPTARVVRVREGQSFNLSENVSNALGSGAVRIGVNKYRVAIPITEEVLRSAWLDVDTEMRRVVTSTFQKDEGELFLKGSGIDEPEGLINCADLTTISVSSDCNGSLYEALVLAHNSLKEPYQNNAVWFFNRKTLSELQLLRDDANRPLWHIDLTRGEPSLLLGNPYAVMQDMPDPDNLQSEPFILYGDFSSAYAVVDGSPLEIMRDPYTLIEKDIILLWARRRLGGKVIMPEAYVGIVP